MADGRPMRQEWDRRFIEAMEFEEMNSFSSRGWRQRRVIHRLYNYRYIRFDGRIYRYRLRKGKRTDYDWKSVKSRRIIEALELCAFPYDTSQDGYPNMSRLDFID